MTTERRRGGRPRKPFPTVSTSIHIPTPVYDAICRRALRRGCSVHRLLLEMIRQGAGAFERIPSQKTESQT